MAEPRSVNADEELIIFDFGYRAVLQLIWHVVLIPC